MDRPEETEESGPVYSSIWDTRIRENTRWCPYCKHWLSLTTFFWITGDLDEKLKYHQRNHCFNSPTYISNRD